MAEVHLVDVAVEVVVEVDVGLQRPQRVGLHVKPLTTAPPVLNRRGMRHVLLVTLVVLNAEYVRHAGAGRHFLALRAVSGALLTPGLREQPLHLVDALGVRDDVDASGLGPVGRF